MPSKTHFEGPLTLSVDLRRLLVGLERLGLSHTRILPLCCEAHRKPLVELLRSRRFEADGESGIEDSDLTVFDAAGICQGSLSG